jgi:molybdenum cofactor cytidylyltransferase
VTVVIGSDARVASAARAAAPASVNVVVNDQPDADMLDSARCGLRALPAACEAVLLAVGDQPGITSALVRQLAEAYRTCGRGLVVPAYRGRRGHPLLFAARYTPEVLAGYDGVGVRGLLRAHPQDVFELPVEDAGAAVDVDIPEDYRRERARAESPPAPPPERPGRGGE